MFHVKHLNGTTTIRKLALAQWRRDALDQSKKRRNSPAKIQKAQFKKQFVDSCENEALLVLEIPSKCEEFFEAGMR